MDNISTPIINTEPQQIAEPVDHGRFESAAQLVMPDARAAMAFVASTPSGHAITLDTDPEHGGLEAGPDPQSLLLVALGSCTGMDVISILRKKRQAVTSYAVNVYGNRAVDHPRIYTHIVVEHVVGGQGVDSRAVARSLELSITKYCPVHALLSKATRVEHVFRVLELPPGAENVACD
jgi:putative redox protein